MWAGSGSATAWARLDSNQDLTDYENAKSRTVWLARAKYLGSEVGVDQVRIDCSETRAELGCPDCPPGRPPRRPVGVVDQRADVAPDQLPRQRVQVQIGAAELEIVEARLLGRRRLYSMTATALPRAALTARARHANLEVG